MQQSKTIHMYYVTMNLNTKKMKIRKSYMCITKIRVCQRSQKQAMLRRFRQEKFRVHQNYVYFSVMYSLNEKILKVYRKSVFIEQQLINLFTPWCRMLLEKLTGLQLVKKFPAFYGTRRFITAFTSEQLQLINYHPKPYHISTPENNLLKTSKPIHKIVLCLSGQDSVLSYRPTGKFECSSQRNQMI